MRFLFEPLSKDLRIRRKAFAHRRAIKQHAPLLFFILGEMQQSGEPSSFPEKLVRNMEMIIRHLLLGGRLNVAYLQQLEIYKGILTLAELASNASGSPARVTYSSSLMAYMLMLVAEATYMFEDLNAADAIKRVERMSDFGLEQYDGGVRGRPDFNEQYGFKVDVKDVLL